MGDEVQVKSCIINGFLRDRFKRYLGEDKKDRDNVLCIENALRCVLEKLQLPDVEKLVRQRNLIVAYFLGTSTNLCCPYPRDKNGDEYIRVVILRESLKDLQFDAIMGEIAHELAHVFLKHEKKSDTGLEREANAQVRNWGLGKELKAFYKNQKK